MLWTPPATTTPEMLPLARIFPPTLSEKKSSARAVTGTLSPALLKVIWYGPPFTPETVTPPARLSEFVALSASSTC